MKKLFLVGLAMFFAATTYAQNITTLSNGQASAETYEISLRATDIDNNTFPVPVPYYDDLVGKKKNLRATLNVPLRLSISNTRSRRLLTVYAQSGDEQSFPYGTELKNIRQIKLNSYKDVNTGNNVLTEFVGPNKSVFRTVDDAANYDIDFILKITVPYFFDGNITVAIGSSNGIHLTEICEVNNQDCMTPVTFKVVPREVDYAISYEDSSEFFRTQPTGVITVEYSNINLGMEMNNKPYEILDRKALPASKDIVFQPRKLNPHYTIKKIESLWATNIDIFGIYPYMSNENYKVDDSIVYTSMTKRPDITAKYNGN